MSLKNPVWRLALGGLAFASVLAAGRVADAAQAEEAKRIAQSVEVLENLTGAADVAIPDYILERAEAIVVIPTLMKAGFVIGAEHGKGIMSVRDRTGGTWSAPSFVTMTGGSIGWQIGVQAVDLVLVVTNQDGITELLESEFTIGASASVAAGPVGRSADAATDAQMSAKILAYSRARGLFAGASIEGASLRPDEDANRRFYGAAVTPAQVFAMPASTSEAPAAADWRAAVARVTPR